MSRASPVSSVIVFNLYVGPKSANGKGKGKRGVQVRRLSNRNRTLHFCYPRGPQRFHLSSQSRRCISQARNEDAERDCTTVLGLSAFNAKALFRRGQARVGMSRLDEGRQDFEEALKREPANASVKEELDKVVEQLAKQNFKVHPALQVTSGPKRRRVPIKIIHPSGTSTPASVSPAPKVTEESASGNDALKPVSSRSLKQQQTPASSISSTSPSSQNPIVNSRPTPSPPAPNTEQPRTFKDAKKERDSTRPSQVGGGIFRASGDSTLFSTRATTAKPTSVPISNDASSLTSATAPPLHKAVTHTKPPTSWYDFSRTWNSLSTTQERWSLFSMIPPSSLPVFFKTSLEPAMLVSILELFREMVVGVSERKSVIREYLDYFETVPRFETVVLFLSRKEKEVARDVWESLGVSKGDLGRIWSSVW